MAPIQHAIAGLRSSGGLFCQRGGRQLRTAVSLTERVRNSRPILIKEIAATVGARKAQGHSIVDLSQGAPCLPIVKAAEERMVEFIRGRQLPYAPVPGIDSVRRAAAQFVNEAYGLDSPFDESQVIITAGGVQACFLVFSLVIESARDVLLTTLPAYGLYQVQATHFGGTLGFVKGRWTDAKALRAAFAEHRAAGRRVRAVVLVTPNNPTGEVMSEQDAQELACALEEELDLQPDGFLVLLDEVYIGLASGPHRSLLRVASPRLRQRICLMLSGSKSLGSMPGARAGFLAVGDKNLVQRMVQVQGCASANASTIAQVGLEASLRHFLQEPSALQQAHAYYAERTAFMSDALNALGRKYGLGTVAPRPQGTFYLWADFGALRAARATTDMELHQQLLDAGLAVVPGSAFSMDPKLKLLRLACSRDDMQELQRAAEIFDATLAKLCD